MKGNEELAALGAAGEFELVGVDGAARAHELRADGVVVARLSLEGSSGTTALVLTRDAAWRFAARGVLRPQVVLTDADSGEEVAAVRPRGISGSHGEVQLGGRVLSYRVEGSLSDRWALLDGDDPIVTVARHHDAERYRVSHAAGGADGLLLLAIACYSAVQSSGGAAASAASAAI